MGKILWGRVIGSIVIGTILATVATAQEWVPPRPYDFVVEPVVSANTAENDYAPTLSNDSGTLWFCSYERPGGFGNADVYRSRALGNNRWGRPLNAGESWNLEDNEGALAISRDGSVAVVAMDERDGLGDTDLWIAELRGDSLVNLRNMGREINSRYWDSQPTISGDGRTIYFASNRPGGYGGVDIWVTRRLGDAWTPAALLDSGVNTPDHERSPYLIANGSVLIFSSDRDGGFGRHDFWMVIDDGGTWGVPVNLGPGVNSGGEELFFHAPADYEYFFFASDRSGGMGGLDIYSGTPNVYGRGFFRLNVRVVDTITGEPAPAYVTVVDVEADRIVWEFPTDAFGRVPYEALLPADRSYSVVARRAGEGSNGVEVGRVRAGERREAVIGFGVREEIAEESDSGYTELILFDLGEYNVPFFVTGYYRPNTPESLPALLAMLNGPLAGATYIERFPRGSARHREYQRYAGTIDSIFGAMADRIIEEISPAFLQLTEPEEIMELVVTGYVDPQVFSGEYLEDIDVSFTDRDGRGHTVRPGDTIENFELSGLRAVYARDLIQRFLAEKAKTENPAYLRLQEAGRVRYRVVAGGVSGGDEAYDRQRRIHVLILRRR